LEVVDKSAHAFLDGVAEEDRQAVSAAVDEVYETAGYRGVFGLCVCVAIMTMPEGAAVESIAVLKKHRVTGEIIPADIDEVSPILRCVVRFIAAVANDDLDTAWALFLAVFDPESEPGNGAQVAFLSYLAQMLNTALEAGE
jgi:hypothetical protein